MRCPFSGRPFRPLNCGAAPPQCAALFSTTNEQHQGGHRMELVTILVVATSVLTVMHFVTILSRRKLD